MTMTQDDQDILSGLKIIDTDTHLSEPAELWTSRAPARFRDQVPRQIDVNGRKRWIIGGVQVHSCEGSLK